MDFRRCPLRMPILNIFSNVCLMKSRENELLRESLYSFGIASMDIFYLKNLKKSIKQLQKAEGKYFL